MTSERDERNKRIGERLAWVIVALFVVVVLAILISPAFL